MNDYNPITCFLISFSAILMYIGIRLANSKYKTFFGTCVSNEKTSLYHDPLIRGLGILYLFALSPIVIYTKHVFSIDEIIIVLLSTLLGFFDDKYGISQIKKILLLIAIIFLTELVFTNYEDFRLFIFVLKVCLYLFFTLLFNQIDGINGLAGSTFVLSCFGFVLLNNNLISTQIIIAVILVTTIYLHTNLKGKIGIQGEAGSFFMGSVIFIFSLKLDNSQDLVYIIMFLFPVLSDVISTTLVRLWYVKNIFISHRNHLYQRLVYKNKSHLKTTALFSIAQFLVIVVTIFCYYLDHSVYKLFSMMIFMSFLIMINFRFSYLIHKEKF